MCLLHVYQALKLYHNFYNEKKINNIYFWWSFIFYVKFHALFHEQSQLGICYEAAICYHNEKSENECGRLLILKKLKWILNAFSYSHCTIYAYLHLKLKFESLKIKSFYPICVRLIYYKYKYSRFRNKCFYFPLQ